MGGKEKIKKEEEGGKENQTAKLSGVHVFF
jgi:hypothetical protein